MIKRTLYFGHPAYLSMSRQQLVVKLPEVESSDLPDFEKEKATKTIPIEDIGYVILDHSRITITHGLINQLLDSNVAVITCDSSHLPAGLLLPLQGNIVQNERFRAQIDSSLPLQKQLWQQTVQAKVRNQGAVLHVCQGTSPRKMMDLASQVKSGDSDNVEAQAANYYWKNLLSHVPGFTRQREGIAPNHLLNYGYAILRAVVARALVSSGLLPTLGIHHHNKYNAYCLADDIMEPYRPFVDQLVLSMADYKQEYRNELTKEDKIRLLNIPTMDVIIQGNRRPLMIAVTQTTASLYRCFTGESRKIIYPTIDG